MPSSQYNVNILISAKDRTSGPAGKANTSLASLKKTVKVLAGAYATLKVAQGAVDFVKFGAGVVRAETALDNLAIQAGTSGDAIVKSIQEASGFTIDRMSAMEAANKALLLEVVKTPEEFAALTRNAVLLGRAMGEDAATSIDKFTRAAGRQSKLIADDLGLKVDLVKVQEETNRLMAEDASLTKDSAKAKAFFNVMMEEATRKTAALGGATRSLATDMEIIDAATKDAKADWAIIAGNYVSGGEGADGLAQKIRGLATTWTQASLIGRAASAGISEIFTGAFDPSTTGIERFTKGWEGAWKAFFDGAEGVGPAITGYTGYVVQSTEATEDLTSATWDYGDSTEDAESGILDYGESTAWLSGLLDAQRLATENATLAQIDLSQSLADASSAQIAQAAIAELKTAYDEGMITIGQYTTAVTETQLAFGLATGKSIALSTGVLDLTAKLEDGSIKAGDFATKLGTMIGEADRGVLIANRLRDALNGIPRNINVSVNVQESIARRERDLTSPGQQFAHGGITPGGSVMVGELGPEMVSPPRGSRVTPASQTTNNYSFKQTVNTRATSHTVMDDWALAEAMAG